MEDDVRAKKQKLEKMGEEIEEQLAR
jgi:hypothetical protein